MINFSLWLWCSFPYSRNLFIYFFKNSYLLFVLKMVYRHDTKKKNRGFIFFRQRRALINIQKETVSHRKETKWTLTIVQKNWIIDNHFRKKWILPYIYLSSHSVGEPIMKQISHLSVVCIGNHMISSAIWNK